MIFEEGSYEIKIQLGNIKTTRLNVELYPSNARSSLMINKSLTIVTIDNLMLQKF